MRELIERISDILKRISHSAMRSGRNPEDIKLIAVTKTVPVEIIANAIEAGLRIFGENRVQEAMEKIPIISREFSDTPIEWHMIGHLQKNKAKHAVKLFEIIHSVDSTELMDEINKHAQKIGKVQKVLIEIKLSHEETKHGIRPDEILTILEYSKGLKNIDVIGLMTIPPLGDNPSRSRPYFRELKNLFDKANKGGFNLKELSMGMSDDFEIAIEEGATMVRIGTAIFGKRDKK